MQPAVLVTGVSGKESMGCSSRSSRRLWRSAVSAASVVVRAAHGAQGNPGATAPAPSSRHVRLRHWVAVSLWAAARGRLPEVGWPRRGLAAAAWAGQGCCCRAQPQAVALAAAHGGMPLGGTAASALDGPGAGSSSISRQPSCRCTCFALSATTLRTLRSTCNLALCLVGSRLFRPLLAPLCLLPHSQCGQAGGQRAQLHGARGQPEAHRLRAVQPLRRRPPRPREAEERQVGGAAWGGGHVCGGNCTSLCVRARDGGSVASEQCGQAGCYVQTPWGWLGTQASRWDAYCSAQRKGSSP